MPRLYDHIDLRVRNLAEVRDFYEVLLPALGFMRETRIPELVPIRSRGAGRRTSRVFRRYRIARTRA